MNGGEECVLNCIEIGQPAAGIVRIEKGRWGRLEEPQMRKSSSVVESRKAEDTERKVPRLADECSVAEADQPLNSRDGGLVTQVEILFREPFQPRARRYMQFSYRAFAGFARTSGRGEMTTAPSANKGAKSRAHITAEGD